MSWSSKYLGEVLKWQVLQKPNQEQQSATHFVKMSFAFPLVNRKAYMDSQGPWTTFPPEWITYTFLIVFLFLVLYRGLHNLSVCVHMLIWLACTSPPPPHMQAGDHMCQISPFDVAPPGAVHFVLWVSISHWAQRWSWASWPAHPRALLFLSKAPASHPVFISSSFVLFVGSGDGFQILMLVQQALYQPNCFPSSQWPVFQLYYLAWLWWIRIFICLSPSHFA